MMKHLKPIAASLVALLLAVVIMQNWAEVEVLLLFFSFRLPLALLLLAVGIAGLLLGALLVALLGNKSERKPPPQ